MGLYVVYQDALTLAEGHELCRIGLTPTGSAPSTNTVIRFVDGLSNTAYANRIFSCSGAEVVPRVVNLDVSTGELEEGSLSVAAEPASEQVAAAAPSATESGEPEQQSLGSTSPCLPNLGRGALSDYHRLVGPQGGFATIQSAIDAGPVPGEFVVIIRVDPGPVPYQENIVIDTSANGIDSAVILYSAQGPLATIIDPGPITTATNAPVISITGPKPVTLGWSELDTQSPASWQGFTIRNGRSDEGGGVRIVDAASVVIAGNVIENNGINDPDPGLASAQGGGVYVRNSGTEPDPVSIRLNLIRDNWASGYPAVCPDPPLCSMATPPAKPGAGGGVYIEAAWVDVSGNVIQANGIPALIPPSTIGGNPPAVLFDYYAEGGGVAIWAGPDAGAFRTVLCRNTIDANIGKVGAGVWVLSGATASRIRGIGVDHVAEFPGGDFFGVDVCMNLHMEDNTIQLQEPWVPFSSTSRPFNQQVQYAGAGAALLYDYPETVVPTCSVAVLNNRLIRNTLAPPPTFAAPGQLGGGFYIYHGVDFHPTSSFVFAGNHFQENEAAVGGALWLTARDTPTGSPGPCDGLVLSEWLQNTFWFNRAELSAGFSGQSRGGAFYIEADSAFLLNGGTVSDNFPTASEWHVECSQNGCAPIGAKFTILPDQLQLAPGNCDPGTNNTEIFSLTDSDLDSLVFPPELELPPRVTGRINRERSAAVDSSDPLLESALTLVVDNLGDSRLNDYLPGGTQLDRGADEMVLAPFIRGDANADHAVNLGDPNLIIAFLFTGGTLIGCQDAADANDSGAIDLSDATFLLGYLFAMGPAPPAPFPLCGVESSTQNDGSLDACLDRKDPLCP
ncbi:MAG: hypothetical protein AB7N24_22005 [Dehalococcoidia bacterium]